MTRSRKNRSTRKKHSDRPPKVSFPVTDMETPLQTAQKYKDAGNVRFKMGKYNEAIARYDKAIDICPKENVDDLAIFYQNRAAAYEELKKYNSVKADCTKALELNPKYTKALLRRARILEQLGDFEAALKDIATACIHENFSNQASLLKAEIILKKFAEQVHGTAENFFMLTTHAIEIYYIRAFSKDPVLSRLEHPENIPEFFKKPLQALKNREYHNIIPLCTEIIESLRFDKLPSSKLEVVLLRATFNLIRCNYNDALNDFEIILSSKNAFDDVRVNALIKRANLHREIGNLHLSFKNFKLAIMINPSCSDIYSHRGEAYLKIKMLDEAKRDFEKAVELNPNFSAAHIKKWYTNFHFAVLNGDLSLAKMIVRDVEKTFDKYSNPYECVGCYVLYAKIMSRTQQYQKADTYFVKAIEKDPDYAVIYMMMSWENFSNIEKYLHKTLTLDTCSIEGKALCLITLKFLEMQRGNIGEAIKLSDKALAFCRTSKELVYMYSVVSKDLTKIFLDIKYRFAHTIRFLRSYSRFIGIQNSGESDKHSPIDNDGPSKVLSPAAESETPLQKAQKYKNEGNVYFKTEKYNNAIAQYTKAIDICPKENKDELATFYQNRAAAYEQLKKYSSVKADCMKALELNPKYTKALLRRARVLEQTGDLEVALKDITTACIHEGFSNPIFLEKAEIILNNLAEQVHGTAENFFLLTTHAIEIYYIRAFSKDPVLSRLEHPENIPEFFKKPLQALKNREYHNIIPLCTEIIESLRFDKLPSSKLEVVLLRATFNLFRRNYNDALNDFEIILSSKNAFDDVRVNALIKKANLYREIGNLHLSFKNFELAITINPSCSDIYYHRGQAYLDSQRLDEAKRDFEKAIELNPNFSAAHMQKWYANYHFAVFNRDLRLAEMTVRDVEKAFDKYSNPPECVCCYVLYAQIMFKTEQYQKADAYFDKAIEKDPDYAIVYLLLWNCNLDNTVEYLNKVLKLETCSIGGKLRCIEMLRMIEIQRENIEEAIKLSDKALVFCRTFKELLYMYSVNAIKMHLNIKNRFGHTIHFLRSYSRFIDIQNAEECDKRIPSDRPSKVPSPAAESETPLQRAQKYKNEGNVYFKTEKYNEAIAQYTKAIDICPKENKDELATFYQNRAAAYEQLKKYSSVKADCMKALELNPKYTKALLRRARVLEQTGDLEAALKDMITACIYEGFPNLVSFEKAEIILKKLVIQHAYENWANRKLLMPDKSSIECYIISFSKDPVFSKLRFPENIPEFFKKPLQALKDTKYDDVIPLCTKIIESPEFDRLPSTKLEVLLLRATFYSLLGEYDSAVQDLEYILHIEYVSDDLKINALLKRTDLNLKFMNLDMAFMNFELAISINPHYSDIYYRRGLVYMHMGKLNKAKHDFEKALEYNPNFTMACIEKCYTDYRIAMLNGDVRLVEMAVRAFEKVSKKYTNLPECTFCYLYYRTMMSEIQQYQKAHIYFTKIIKKHPRDISMSSVYLQGAFLQFKWNGYSGTDKAVEYLKKAIELDEKYSLAYQALGIVEIKRGNIEEAIRLFDKALVYCRTFKELLNLYYLRDTAKVELNIKNQFGDKYFDFFDRYLGSIQTCVLRIMEESVKGSITIIC